MKTKDVSYIFKVNIVFIKCFKKLFKIYYSIHFQLLLKVNF